MISDLCLQSSWAENLEAFHLDLRLKWDERVDE